MGEARVWQIACGERRREYSSLFLKHDLMFLGPGDPGPYSPEAYTDVGQSAPIAAFCKELRPDDLVLLRFGHQVLSIGVVPDHDYQWCPWLDDVYGWDLQHCRRVIWQDQLVAELAEIQAKRPLFAGRGQMSMFTRVHHEPIHDRVKHLFGRCKLRTLRPLPELPSEPLPLDEFGQRLFSRGLPNSAVDRVLLAIQHARRMLQWYEQHGKESARPDEHEVVAHLVLPLMLALGWSEQLLAVEWHKVDLAAFRATPTTAATCVLACEAKRMGVGLQEKVVDQARNYVKRLGLSECRQILVTDGPLFHLYRRKGKDWEAMPSGYINLQKLRTRHLAPAGTDAVATLMALTPAGVERTSVSA